MGVVALYFNPYLYLRFSFAALDEVVALFSAESDDSFSRTQCLLSAYVLFLHSIVLRTIAEVAVVCS